MLSIVADENPAPEPPATLRVVAWTDPIVDRLGIDARGAYVEQFWLPVLGPSATWLLRHLVDGLSRTPQGFRLDLDEAARSLGLGGQGGRRSPFQRSVLRCCRYGLAHRPAPGSLGVRRWVGPVPERHLRHLPTSIQEAHERWAHAETTRPAGPVRARARLLAADLVALGADRARTETLLARVGIHPAVAHESVAWAIDRLAADRPR